MIAIAQIIVGAFQVLLGRKIFWLMVGLSGFLVGLYLTTQSLDWPTWLKLLFGVGVGLVFGLLAVSLQKPMASILAFLAFGIAAAVVLRSLGVDRGNPLFWIIVAGAGILGAILVFSVYEWALIIGTSLLGASSITSGLNALTNLQTESPYGMIVWLLIIAAGIAIQSRSMKRKISE